VTRIAIIDSGGANIASLLYALERLGADAILTKDAQTIRRAERVILPGVGAARDAMNRLGDAGLVSVIKDLTQPVLGICLGMQLLCEASEEEDVECLGIVPGIARKLPIEPGFPVPNMGWCSTTWSTDHPVLRGIEDGSHFYYLHSYALPVSPVTIATADHSRQFAAMICHKNFVAAQFHPERSSSSGARLLKNFVEIEG